MKEGGRDGGRDIQMDNNNIQDTERKWKLIKKYRHRDRERQRKKEEGEREGESERWREREREREREEREREREEESEEGEKVSGIKKSVNSPTGSGM